MPISFVDGTFEADDTLIWSQAYACARPDWTPDNVAQLLHEFERVGLLRRVKDADGRVWGFWTGSDNFLPPPSHRDRYKNGKRSLFGDIKDASSSAPEDIKNESKNIPLGLGVGVGSGLGKGLGSGLDSAAKSSENEQQQKPEQSNPKSKSVFVPSTPTPTPTATATPTPTPKAKRPVLSRDEYEHEKSRGKTDAQLAEWAAEIAAREPCPNCGAKHPLPACQPKTPTPITPEQEKQFENQELTTGGVKR